MLETILNLVWFFIAVAGIWLWRNRWSARHAGDETRMGQGWMALVVIIFLLFPVISLTDDLHPGPTYLEDSSASKRRAPALHQAAVHRVQSHARQRAEPAALPPDPTFGVASLIFANLAVGRSVASSPFLLADSGRSPPAIPF